MQVETREVIVEGTPRSQQAASRSIQRWKQLVVAAAKAQSRAQTTSIQFVDVSVQILHFCPEADTQGDLDNIAKPILDALCASHCVLFNDNQVKELLLRRIEWEKRNVAQLENATPHLAARFQRAVRGEAAAEFVYISITTELTLEKLP